MMFKWFQYRRPEKKTSDWNSSRLPTTAHEQHIHPPPDGPGQRLHRLGLIFLKKIASRLEKLPKSEAVKISYDNLRRLPAPIPDQYP